MGKGLQREITAEGVETEVQAAFLKQRGCQQAQGFYYGKPAPAESTVDLLSNPSTLTG